MSWPVFIIAAICIILVLIGTLYAFWQACQTGDITHMYMFLAGLLLIFIIVLVAPILDVLIHMPKI